VRPSSSSETYCCSCPACGYARRLDAYHTASVIAWRCVCGIKTVGSVVDGARPRIAGRVNHVAFSACRLHSQPQTGTHTLVSCQAQPRLSYDQLTWCWARHVHCKLHAWQACWSQGGTIARPGMCWHAEHRVVKTHMYHADGMVSIGTPAVRLHAFHTKCSRRQEVWSTHQAAKLVTWWARQCVGCAGHGASRASPCLAAADRKTPVRACGLQADRE
jgi:hypothetical protein